MNRCVMGWIAGMAVMASGLDGWAQERAAERSRDPDHPSTPDPETRSLVVARAIVAPHELRQHGYAEVDLQRLRAGQRFRVRLQVVNRSDQAWEFARFDFNCRCLTPDSPPTTIPARGSQDFEFLLTTAQRAVDSQALHQIRFLRADGQVVAQVDLKYKLSHMFAVTRSPIQLKVPRGTASATTVIPVVITPPLTRDDLELRIAKPLQGLDIQWAQTAEGTGIQVVAAAGAVQRGELAGSVGVHLRGTEDSDGFYLTVLPSEPVSIAPMDMNLIRSTDGREYLSQAVLSLEGKAVTNADQPVPQVQVRVGDQVHPVQVEHLLNGTVFRLQLALPVPPQAPPGNAIELEWLITLGQETWALRSHARTPERQ